MELTTQSLSQRMILTAAMPFDDLNAIEKLIADFQNVAGLAFLPSFVKTARELLPEGSTSPIIGLVGYPTGGVTTRTKVNEVRDMVYLGVKAFHLVVNTGFILSGNWDDVQCEILSVVHSANNLPISLIMEAAYLSDHQIMRLVNLCAEVGIMSIGTSTGWLPLNPDTEQIQRIKEMIYGRMSIMVAGAVNLETAIQTLESGADTIIIRQQHAEAILAQLA